MRAFFHFPLGRAEKVEGGQKIKLGKKIKASTGLCKPFLILHIAGEPFNGYAENAGKYDKFIIGYKAQAGFYAADRLAPYAKTGHLEFGGKCILREALRGAGLVDFIAGDIGLALVCINLQTFSPRFT
jgi:hypothetical protein